MTAHTPGPWLATEHGVRAAGGYIAHSISVQRYEGQEERYAREVSQSEADKRLISAAPDLLAALIQANNVLEIIARISPDDVPRTGSLGQMMRDAIAKATGDRA